MERPKRLIGKIKERQPDRVRNKKSPYYGNQFWRCQVVIEDEPKIREILIFKEWLERENIWEEIEAWKLEDNWNKQYYFKVQRKPGAGKFFRLLDWQELNHEKN